MSAPMVELTLWTGAVCVLRPGEIIGRSPSAAIRLNEPSISEAHAMLSLRGRALRLLRLRGAMYHRDQPVQELPLEPNLRFSLGPGLDVQVREVVLPARIPRARIGGGPPVELTRGAYSVVIAPAPEIVVGYDPGASAWLWIEGATWFFRGARGEPEPLEAVHRRKIEGLLLEIDEVQTVGTSPTAVELPLRILIRASTVEVERPGQPTSALRGKVAQLLTAIFRMGPHPTPVSWLKVASEALWPELDTRDAMDLIDLRARWDHTRQALRRQLAEAGIQRDLVRSSGGRHAVVQLNVQPDDLIAEDAAEPPSPIQGPP